MTGLAAGIRTGLPVFEAESVPGGICSSYYIRPGSRERLQQSSPNAYRFEYGGGHWIFGGDQEILDFIERYAPFKKYRRSSAVYLPEEARYIPYPLQYHLSHLQEDVANAALRELMEDRATEITTMADWVRVQFGPALNDVFFAPFHELYTAGLWSRIRPQDNYKTPLDKALVQQGATEKAPDAGYNATFVYPAQGLDRLALEMAAACQVSYGKRVVDIDIQARKVKFEDGEALAYDRLYTSLPLNQMVRMTGIELASREDPYTAVLVLNVGAVRGPACPDEHWIYVPSSESGFHRVGFYSNVDAHFLPQSPADGRERTSLYIERAFLPGEKPSPAAMRAYEVQVVRELQAWGYIEEAEVVDATWVEVAYTWSWPGSTWIEEAIAALKAHNIEMLGRYGRWHFQGIAASIREGLRIAI